LGIALYIEEGTNAMNDAEDSGLSDLGSVAHGAGEQQPRAVGSPLQMGAGDGSPLPPMGDSQRFAPVPPPGRALTNSSGAAGAGEASSSLQRALSALRLALPFVQRIIPLIDGNIATAVSNILTPHPHAPPPQPPVNLVPIEDGLAELQSQHRDLRNQFVEQNSSLKRVEDQLEMVREATDRNTLKQQELLEDLKTVAKKVNIFAFLAFGLLALSILLNVVLYLHIQRVLP
jgi:hypothetical protein